MTQPATQLHVPADWCRMPTRVCIQILEKLGNAGAFQHLHGCISTGKEANVYSASTAAEDTVAVKIYKTSILVFKDRDRQGVSLMCMSAGLHAPQRTEHSAEHHLRRW